MADDREDDVIGMSKECTQRDQLVGVPHASRGTGRVPNARMFRAI